MRRGVFYSVRSFQRGQSIGAKLSPRPITSVQLAREFRKMRDKLTRRNLFLLATTSVLGLGLAALPMAVDLDWSKPVLKSAWADGGDGGSGGDGGEGGGDSGGGGSSGGDDGGHGGDDGGESGHSGDDSGHSSDDGGDDSGVSGDSGNSGPGSVNSSELEADDDSRSRP